MKIPSLKVVYAVYIMQCSDGTFYIGFTSDLKRRFEGVTGVLEVATPGDVDLSNLCMKNFFSSYRRALKREYQIKQRTREAKKVLIVGGIDGAGE